MTIACARCTISRSEGTTNVVATAVLVIIRAASMPIMKFFIEVLERRFRPHRTRTPSRRSPLQSL